MKSQVNIRYFGRAPAIHHASLWLLAIVVISFVAWASVAELDEVTRASGSVIASSKTKVVQAPDTGVISEISVVEGARVAEGDIVATLAADESASVVAAIEAERASLLAIQARLKAEISRATSVKFPDSLAAYPRFRETQLSIFKTRRTGLREELSGIQSVNEKIERELNLLRPLLARKDVSEIEVIRLERQLAEQISKATAIENRFFKEAAAELADVEAQLAAVEQRLMQGLNRLARTELRAPVNGVVKSLAVTTVGGVVGPGEVLMEILPIDDTLIIEVEISPTEIAFVSVGQRATIKMDAYDYTIFGDLEGELVYISPDTLIRESERGAVPFYRAQVRDVGKRFSKQPDFDFQILPGMTASVEIITGSNTVLNYLLKPITKTLSQALSER